MFENLALIYFSALIALFITLAWVIVKSVRERRAKKLPLMKGHRKVASQ